MRRVVAASVVALLGCAGDAAAPAPAAAAFPRIAQYRIESSIDADAEAVLSRADLLILDGELDALDPAALRRLRASDPSADLLAYVTSEELPRAVDDAEQPLATARFDRVTPEQWLLEAGSSLAGDVDAEATVLPVVDASAFSVRHPASDFYGRDEPTYLLLDAEHVRLVDVRDGALVVERGYRSARVPHAAGTHAAAHVVFFAGTWMLDIASTAPPDAHGRRYRDLLVDDVAAMVERGPWTGAFLDVCFEDISWLDPGRLDLDRDGVADDPAAASRAWSEGFGELADALRARLGDAAPIVANPGAQNCPHASLDGILLEGWPVGLPPAFIGFREGLDRYRAWSSERRGDTIANAFSPKIGFGTIGPGDDEIARTDFAAMRLGLTVALLGDGFYAYDNGVFGHYVAWTYDDYDGGGLGRGFLGAPAGDAAELPSGAWTRDFEHGFAVANPTDAAVAVDVPAGLAKIRGHDDPAHDDGGAASTPLRVDARDGYVLVRP